MIILIGGQSFTGKTLLAQQLLEEYKITYLSIDHLKMGLCRGLDAEKYSPIQDYKVLGEKLWPIVRGIIMANIENGQNLIVEGCYILPNLARDFDEKYLKEIVTIFLGFSEEYIRRNYDDAIRKHFKAIEQRGEIFGEPMESYIKQTAELKAKCEKSGCAYFEIGKDYMKEIAKVKEYIRRSMEKSG